MFYSPDNPSHLLQLSPAAVPCVDERPSCLQQHLTSHWTKQEDGAPFITMVAQILELKEEVDLLLLLDCGRKSKVRTYSLSFSVCAALGSR